MLCLYREGGGGGGNLQEGILKLKTIPSFCLGESGRLKSSKAGPRSTATHTHTQINDY